MSSRTETALIARGFDNATARKLAVNGFTLSKLKSVGAEELRNIGLDDRQIERLHDESRPPIPSKNVTSLLYKSAFTCCVCRQKGEPIIIHHIQEWHKSRNHEEANLVVLCLNCHSKAHSTNTISINLSKDRLISIKAEWEASVRKRESDALFTKTSWLPLGGVWDYFNHNRISDIVGELNLDLQSISNYANLRKNGTISENGAYVWPQNISAAERQFIRYIYDGSVPGFNSSLRQFYAQILKKLLENTQWLDVSGIFKRSTAKLISNYPIITATGAFRYRRANDLFAGPGQTIMGSRTAKGLRVEFSIDAWETTSSSANSVNLCGVGRSTCILLVRSIIHNEKSSIVKCTCLAIGTGFTEYVSPVPAIAYRDDEE